MGKRRSRREDEVAGESLEENGARYDLHTSYFGGDRRTKVQGQPGHSLGPVFKNRPGRGHMLVPQLLRRCEWEDHSPR